MSARLVSAVFASSLPAWLKPYAIALATFAADDGRRVYPTIARLARMVGRSDRATQTAIGELRRLGVLTLEAPAGRYRATRYVFRARALARFPQGGVQKPRPILVGGDDFHRHSQELTGSWVKPTSPDQSVRTSTNQVHARETTDGECPKAKAS